ncbi:Ig-like domain-containing protein [Desulfobacterota bacterium M19]
MNKHLPIWLELVILLVATSAQAYVIDAPHNETNGITCSSCHTYSLWWQYSPSDQRATTPDRNTIVNTVCMQCHNGSGTAPAARTHSSAVIGSPLHGTWGIGCTDCHDPHYQGQLSWVGTPTSPFLITGTINSATYDSAMNQTTIKYSSPTTNTNWPPSGAAASDQDWANKSASNPNRGLVFVHDTTNTSNTFLIVSATASLVVVKGQLDPASITPGAVDSLGHTNPATSNTFGLIYGQLIKDKITPPFGTGSKDVRFFDPNGGFVEEDASGSGNTSGICQVCHTGNTASGVTVTTHFSSNGIFPASTDSHYGRQTMNCTNCHKHDKGFKGTGHDVNTFSWAGDCADCHNDGGFGIVDGVHRGICTLCHNNPGGGRGTTIVGTGGDGDATLGAALADFKTATCLTCHPPVTYPKPWIHHDTAPAQNGNCTTSCHNTTTGHAANHSTMVALNSNCANCHTGTEGGVNNVPTDALNNKVHDACTTCHEINITTKNVELVKVPTTNGLTIAMPDGGTVGGNDGGGDCVTCHGAYFTKHKAADHTTAIAGVSPCNGCHTTSAGTATGAPVDYNDPKVHDSCATCHDIVTGSLLSTTAANVNGYVRGTMSPGTCTTCHGSYFDYHVHGTTGGYVSHDLTFNPALDLAQAAPGTGCNQCHDDAGLGLGTSALSTWEAIKIEHATVGGKAQASACATCHDYAGNGNQSGKPDTPLLTTVQDTIANGLNNTCTTCHTAKKTPNTHGGHNATVFSGDAVCTTCHTIPVSGVVQGIHKNICTLCHTTMAGGKGTTITGSDGDATLGAALTDFRTATCLTCHPPATFPTGGIHHDTTLAINNDCLTCHSNKIYPNAVVPNHTSMIADTSTSPTCASCHTGTPGTANGAPISAADPLIHDSCRTCHTFNVDKRGILVNFTNSKGVNGTGSLPDGGSIGGTDGGGECTVCHTAAAATFHHTNANAKVGNCEYCHDDPRVPRMAGAWDASTPGDNGNNYGTSVPTQMACQECHVSYSGGNMLITKFTRSNYTSYAADWTRTTQHIIPNTAGRINNYGICFSCHNGTTAAAVSVWHARPDKHSPSTWALNTSDRNRCNNNDAHYAPGRSWDGNGGKGNNTHVSSSIGGFNLFYNYYKSSKNEKYEKNCRDNDKAFNNRSPSTPAFMLITVPSVSGNNNSGGSVPVFTSLTPDTAAAGTGVPDNVKVQSAVWDGSKLTVTATNTDGCNTLSVITEPDGVNRGLMTGTGSCTLTVAIGSVPTAVSVNTTNTNGLSVSNYPVTDKSAPVPASAVDDNLNAAASGITDLNVMANDSGSSIVITSVNQPDLGSVTIAGGGTTVAYTGAGIGSTSFTYTITANDASTSTATVSLTIVANQPPTFGQTSYTMPKASVNTVYSASIAGYATDPDGDTITYSKVSGPAWLTIATDGTLGGTPGTGDTGVNTFTFQALATGGTDSASFNITVDAPPSFTSIFEGFESYADGTSGPWGTPAWTPGDSGNGSLAQYWWVNSGDTPSNSTGPSSAASGNKYVYLETSSNQASDNNRDYFIESPVLDGSTYSLALSFSWNMHIDDDNNDAVLWVEVWNGSTWVKVSTVNTGDNGNTWSNTTIDLNNYNNSDIKARIYYHRGTDTGYKNDIALDNLTINGTSR